MVVLSLCDGIGAVTQALAQMNIKAKVFTSEILEEALRVTTTQHPCDTKLGDLTAITDKQLDEVASSAQHCGHILFAAGTPCQDNTELKGTQREGLSGKKSSLFHRVADTRKRLQKRLTKGTTKLHTLIENVTGTSQEDVETITTATENNTRCT